MSWFNTLVPFAAGFCQGFMETFAGDERAGSSHSPAEGKGFDQGLYALGDVPGISRLKVRGRGASMVLSREGDFYSVFVALADGRVVVMLCSTIQFPPRRIPPDVVWQVKSQNVHLPRCDFDVMDLDDCSMFCIRCGVDPDAFTPYVFQAVLTEMVTCMAIVDSTLIEYGHAR